MSNISDIIDAILTDVGTAVAGVTTSKEATQVDERPAEDFPFAEVLQTDYDVEELDYLQETRIWTVSGALWRVGATRDEMETSLEAIRDQIVADPTLGGKCDRALCVTALPESHPDADRTAGVFVVRAEKVA